MHIPPPTQGTRRRFTARRLTHVLAWIALVLGAPLLLMTATRQLPPAIAAQANKVPHTFRFDASSVNPKPQRVVVAGSFNGWSRDATPMKRTGGDVWEATVPLPEGITFYKFVLDGDKWTPDPNSDRELEEDDGHGGKNSAVLIGPDWRKLPAVKPDHIDLEQVRFDPGDPAFLNVASESQFTLRLKVRENDIRQANVIFENAKGPQPAQTIAMQKLGTARGFDEYAAIVPANRTHETFRIQLIDGSATATLGNPFSVEMKPTFTTPAWARDAVWYQIFPERFRNGDPSNDPGDFVFERLVPWNGDWWATQPGEAPGNENFFEGAGNVWKRRYGGDLAGVIQQLPYLRSLGVNAIYFNPIFEAESMHKYDTADFRHVDDNFGVRDPRSGGKPILGNRELFEIDGTPVPAGYQETDDPATWKWTKSDLLFLNFLEEAHRQGFKVIIDGVFNHVGRAHPFFQDVLVSGRNSRYADWFEITDWGDPANWRKMDDPWAVHGKPGGIQWKAWDKDNGHLPVFKKDTQRGLAAGPYKHIMDITQRWLTPGGGKRGIDGWRLDVPGDIPHGFWIEWRKLVKSANPDAYISGEIWTWAQDWLQGDQFDAVMNYRFAEAAQDFFVDRKTAISPSQLNQRVGEIIYNYPLQVSLVQQNLFDSHDTDRLASMFVNPDRAYDAQNRPQDNAKEVGYDARKPTDEEWTRFLQAVAFQMTFVGAPMIYYGNEAGMFSPDDPSNRMPFWWKDQEPFANPDFRFNDRVFGAFQKLIAIRNKFPALRQGSFRPLIADDSTGVYAFARSADDQLVYVVINRSDKPQTVLLPVVRTDPLFDYLGDATEVKFDKSNPTARPQVVLRDGAKSLTPQNGKVSVSLPPYGTAILSP